MSVYNITLINSLGLPITILETGMFCFATCIHPPGAAHRSTHTRDFCRNSNLRFNCISLKAARDLNPEIMKSYLTVVKMIITHVRCKLKLPRNNSWRLRGGWNVALPSFLLIFDTTRTAELLAPRAGRTLRPRKSLGTHFF